MFKNIIGDAMQHIMLNSIAIIIAYIANIVESE